MADKTVKHKSVGEELDSTEWISEELHDLPTESVLLISKPPVGGHKIYNIWRTAEGNIKYEYEDIAKP